MSVTVSSGTYKILESGTVITFDEQSDLSFDLDLNDSLKFTLTLRFISNEGDEIKMVANVNDQLITITCENFDNVLGTGVIQPLQLAIVNDKKLFFRFWVRKLGKSATKEIAYTFYIER